jgi:hypothetical protein
MLRHCVVGAPVAFARGDVFLSSSLKGHRRDLMCLTLALFVPSLFEWINLLVDKFL